MYNAISPQYQDKLLTLYHTNVAHCGGEPEQLHATAYISTLPTILQ